MTNYRNRRKNNRLERSLSQPGIAQVAKVTNATVSEWESKGGEAMSAISAFRIKKHLNIDPFWLATGKDTDNSEQPFSKISAETINLARQINQLPKQQRDFIHRIVSVMRF